MLIWDTWKESYLNTPVETILEYMDGLCEGYTSPQPEPNPEEKAYKERVAKLTAKKKLVE